MCCADVKDENNRTPLHLACYSLWYRVSERKAMVQFLVEKAGCDFSEYTHTHSVIPFILCTHAPTLVRCDWQLWWDSPQYCYTETFHWSGCLPQLTTSKMWVQQHSIECGLILLLSIQLPVVGMVTPWLRGLLVPTQEIRTCVHHSQKSEKVYDTVYYIHLYVHARCIIMYARENKHAVAIYMSLCTLKYNILLICCLEAHVYTTKLPSDQCIITGSLDVHAWLSTFSGSVLPSLHHSPAVPVTTRVCPECGESCHIRCKHCPKCAQQFPSSAKRRARPDTHVKNTSNLLQILQKKVQLLYILSHVCHVTYVV